MKTAKVNKNFTKKILQTDVTVIWLVSLNSIINKCLNNFKKKKKFIGDMLVCKTYIVSIISSLWVNYPY